MRRSAVVTGVSTGIGWGITHVLLKGGFRVFGTVRKQSDSDRLHSEFGPNFVPLLVDVTNRDEVQHAADQVRDSLGNATLFGLVNNAGISLVGPLLHQPLEEFRRQLEVNLVAPLLVTQAFAPLLGADRTRVGDPGRIVNISSVGGRMGAPFLGMYAATKHGLEGMSETLRRELMLYGIDVVIVEPGYVNTPILDKAESDDMGRYTKTDYGVILARFAKGFLAAGRKGLHPTAIGEVVKGALVARHPKVIYTVAKQKFLSWTLPRLLPKRTVDRIIGSQLGLTFPNRTRV
jgi:NAD(P)-dependent dehydrogenase (short-subunit alcohol dehydrogenase family)